MPLNHGRLSDRESCLDAIELVLEMLEVERSRFWLLRWASPRGVPGTAGLRVLLPSPLPLVLFPSLLTLLQAGSPQLSKYVIIHGSELHLS